MAANSYSSGTQDQPADGTTKKTQKRYQSQDRQLNSELDYIHERINKILVEGSVPKLSAGASTADNTSKINAILDILLSAGLLK